jgi:glycosyltransferase involved in cell wall biosynthesis
MKRNIDSDAWTNADYKSGPKRVTLLNDMARRLERIEKERTSLRSEVALLQTALADCEARLAQLRPVLKATSIVRSGLRVLAGVVTTPVRAVRMLAGAPTMARDLREAMLRSERLIKAADSGEWTSKLDHRAYMWHASRVVGLWRPTIYRANLQQRLSMARRPRVLHVIPNVWVGGSTQLILDLHEYLGHRFEMEIVTSALPAHGRHKGMKISLVSRPPSQHEVRRLFTSFRPHLAHIHYWGSVDEPWYRAFFEVAAEFDCPILQNVNTPVTPFTSVQVMQNVFVSQSMLDEFGSGVGAQVIHPGINLSLFSPPETSDPTSYDAIGMVYRLERDKLNEASIEPFITVVKHRPQTRAIIVGDGSLFAHFRSRVREEGLLNRFEFTGFVPYEELPAHYARFKIFVAPVWQESFGQVIPFAMSMGLAIVGNRVGAIPEILSDVSTLGTTPEETAHHVLRLLENKDMIDAIGMKNCSIARTNFSVQRMAVAYAEVYRGIIPGEADLMPDYPPAVYFPL